MQLCCTAKRTRLSTCLVGAISIATILIILFLTNWPSYARKKLIDAIALKNETTQMDRVLSTVKTKLSTDNQHHNQLAPAALSAHPRHKRAAAAPASSSAEPEQQCHTLTNLWQFLKTNYPALARHLLRWADTQASEDAALETETEAGREKEPATATTTTTTTTTRQRQLGHILKEADRQLAAQLQQQQQQRQRNTTSQQQQQQAAPGGKQVAAWLARANTNPNYARLIAHLRTKQAREQQQQQQQQLERSQLSGDNNQHVSYGRVAHYPHELAADRRHHQHQSLPTEGDSGGGGGLQTTRTLDKLHLLNQLTRVKQQQQQQQLAAAQDAELQSNQIASSAPLTEAGAEIEQATANDWRKSSDSAEAARNKFVYGEVLLRPNQGPDGAPQRPDHWSGSDRPAFSALREMAAGARRAHPKQADPSYGKIISRPLSSPANEDLLDSGADNSNELLGQQQAHRFALNGNAAEMHQQQGAEEGEFEGHFHAGPLKEISVRQLRSSSDKGYAPVDRLGLATREQVLAVKSGNNDYDDDDNKKQQSGTGRHIFIVD